MQREYERNGGRDQFLRRGVDALRNFRVMHQHEQPERDARGRPARAEVGRRGAQVQAVGEDITRAGLEGRASVSRTGHATITPERRPITIR